jgi:opacity protein-like surface antigen
MNSWSAAAFALCAAAFAQSSDLDRGKKEVRVFAGMSTSRAVSVEPTFSGGAEAAVGLNRIIAITGNYATSFHRISDQYCAFNECLNFEEHRRLDEFMGGVRFSVPNPSRITPYGVVTAGALVLTDHTSASGPSFRSISSTESSAHFGVAVGGGVNFRITPRFGIAFDARGIYPIPSTAWYLPTTGGVYFRF